MKNSEQASRIIGRAFGILPWVLIIDPAGGITAYGYDRARRLTDVIPSAGLAQAEEHYSYDAVGNRTSSQIGGQS